MGNRALVERRLKLRVVSLVAASLTMLLVTAMPALAAQAPGDGVLGEPDSTGQPEPAQGSPAEPLTEPPAESLIESPVAPSVGVPGNCAHAAGEFLVGYVSEEALRAAPQGNVVETFDGILAQHLVFEDIKSIADPAARLAAEEAKRQELAAQPGVAYAEYNCIAEANQAAAADEGASIPLPKSAPASCGDCGRSVVEGARRIIADGFQGAGSKDAFDAAVRAARTADDKDNMAFASELNEEGSAEDQYTGDAGSSDADSTDSDSETDDADSDDGSSSSSSSSSSSGDANSEDDTESGEDDTGSDAGDADSSDADSSDGKAGSGEESGSGERAGNTESGGEDESAGVEGEDTGGAGASDAGSVSGKNAAVSEEPGVVSGPRVLALGAGGLLLAAGVFVGRRILRV